MMNRRCRVLLDCDGILADFVSRWLSIINACGVRVSEAEITSWDIFEAIKPRFSSEEAFRNARRVCTVATGSEGFHNDLLPYADAVDGVARVSELADVHIVTSPWNGPFWCHERDAWIEDHFGISRKRVTHTAAKYICVGDVLVDDKLENLTEWKEHHPNGAALLWHRPWNASAEIPRGVNVVRDWIGVETIVRALTATRAA